LNVLDLNRPPIKVGLLESRVVGKFPD